MSAVPRATSLYAGLALAATWPLALHLGTHVPGAERWGEHRLFMEAATNLWNLWWFRHALLDLHQSPFQCPLLFHPFGANLWLHALAPVHGAVGVLLQTAVSLTVAQNLIILGNLVAAGLCARALARRFQLTEAGALLAGSIYAFSPPVLAHLYVGHYELVSTFWLPAVLLLFLRILDRPRLPDGIALGLLLAASAYTVQYYFIYGAELLVVAAVVHARGATRPDRIKVLAASLIVASIALAPLVGAWLAVGDAVAPHPMDFDWYSGDLLSYVLPTFAHPVLSRPFGPLYERLTPGPLRLPQETTMFLGLAALALAVVGWRARRRERRPLALLAAVVGVFFTLSLGSHLKVCGFNTGLPLPAAVLHDVPVLRLARAPGRHVAVVTLGLGIFAGAGYDALRRRWLRLAAPLLVAFEYAIVPFPLFPTAIAPEYQRLAQVPGDYAVLELPLQVRDGQRLIGQPNPDQTLGQTLHGHPVVGGIVSRLPPATVRGLIGAPVIGTLLNPVGATRDAMGRDLREGPAWFERNRIRAIVVHASFVGGPQERYVEQVLRVANRESLPDGARILWFSETRSPAGAAGR